MKRKQQYKKLTAWLLTATLCCSSFFVSGEGTITEAKNKNASDNSNVLCNPVIEAQEGQVMWDTIYFGNYWQSKYIPQSENRPTEGEDDVVHEDTDGTKFMVREDKSCYRYDPIQWRILSVNEDGTDAFLIAENTLDMQPYHNNEEENDSVMWETSSLRTWLNDDFINAAFTEDEQNAIVETEIENKKNPYVQEDALGDGENTLDKVYMLSMEEATTSAYGFTDSLERSDTRTTEDTDYVKSGGTIKSADGADAYWLRTLGTEKGFGSRIYTDDGVIPTHSTFLKRVNDIQSVRPVLHLDLTKTDVWSYAGKVKQDREQISSVAPTMSPTQPPSVTMAPGQTYPKNPEINAEELTLNTWDCIYFGNYYNTKITPSTLSLTTEDDVVKPDENNNQYLTRRDQGYFRYDPIKWRVLSINSDGTDAFLMADQTIDLAQYYEEGDVEITWEKSDIRQWLNSEFINKAFTESEQGMIKETTVQTADNELSGEPGGNDTEDKIYLPSIEEMLTPSYGFSSDAYENDTRSVSCTAYADRGGSVRTDGDAEVYWLRSPGPKKGFPAKVGRFSSGHVLINPDTVEDNSSTFLGVRPVMHVDLSNTSMWTYAGKVTPNGVVEPVKEELPPQPTPTSVVVQPTNTPTNNSTNNATKKSTVKKTGNPSIKQLKNVKGKKVKVTLTKKISGATGYQVAYATKSSMKKQKVKSFKSSSITIKGLKKKKTYYFRVRAYKKQSGKTVYSSWGKIKKIKIKK